MGKLAILDVGAQYSKVIDRRVRELKVESDILPLDTKAAELSDYKGIIISGGPGTVYGKDAPDYDPKIFSLGKPMLGICIGMQLMAHVLGGKVEKKDIREYGPQDILVDTESKLFKGLSSGQRVLMSHGDSVDKLPPGFKATGTSGSLMAAIENVNKNLYSVQFHPEVDLTENGKVMLKNFLYDICGFKGDYSVANRKDEAIKEIRGQVGTDKVLMLVSGGVDSNVCAALLNEALGPDKVIAIHIDTGFMRKNESKMVHDSLKKHGLDLKVIDASEVFANGTTIIDGKETKKLKETVSPEEKRKIIGDTFIKVAEDAISELGLDFSQIYLAQGTLRPDLIESASIIANKSQRADTIKTHHNDTEKVRKLREKGSVIEPLRDYHKDEVRELGKMLGLPDELVWRQPFPGPGLAVRIICAEDPYISNDFKKTNRALADFVPEGVHATLLPFKTVGVQGDDRTYKHPVALSGKRNWKELSILANEIPKRFHDVNRVLYVFGDPIEGPIKEITPTHLTKDVINTLQEADAVVNKILLEEGLMKKLSQVPVILFPIEGKSIGIRTFITNDFMTGVPAIPGQDIPEKVVDKMVSEILKIPDISRVAYDLTSKPPGTTEWE